MAQTLVPMQARVLVDSADVDKYKRKVARKGGLITNTVTCGHEGDTVLITVEWS